MAVGLAEFGVNVMHKLKICISDDYPIEVCVQISVVMSITLTKSVWRQIPELYYHIAMNFTSDLTDHIRTC